MCRQTGKELRHLLSLYQSVICISSLLWIHKVALRETRTSLYPQLSNLDILQSMPNIGIYMKLESIRIGMLYLICIYPSARLLVYYRTPHRHRCSKVHAYLTPFLILPKKLHLSLSICDRVNGDGAVVFDGTWSADADHLVSRIVES